MISLVQQANGANLSAPPVTVTLNGTTAGNTVIVIGFVNEGVPDQPLSCTGTINAYVALDFQSQNSSGCRIFYCLSGAGGNETVTVTCAGPNYMFVNIREYSSLGLSFDLQADFTSTNTSTPASNSISPANANNLLIGEIACRDANAAGSGSSPTGSWGNIGNPVTIDQLFCAVDQINVGPGSYQATFSMSGAFSTWAAGIASFFEAAISTPIVGIDDGGWVPF